MSKALIKAGFIQFDPIFGQIHGNVKQACQMLESVDADLMVLPELFSTGYFITDSKELPGLAEEIPGGFTVNQLSETARQKKMHIVAGVLEKSDGRYFNSAVLVGPKGYIATYRKIHLFNEEKLWFTPGDIPLQVYDIGICRVGMMICFDWIFPETMRVLNILGAQVAAHPSNLVMPYCPGIMPSRCFDNRIFAITANRIGTEIKEDRSLSYIGRSLVADPTGAVLLKAGEKDEIAGVVKINPKKADNKRINDFNHLLSDRRPEMYGPLTETSRKDTSAL